MEKEEHEITGRWHSTALTGLHKSMERTRESNESRYIQNNFQTDSIPVLFEKEKTMIEEGPYHLTKWSAKTKGGSRTGTKEMETE